MSLYIITKRMEIAGAHKLHLDYDSPCQNIHGHNWIIIVTVKGFHLNHNGLLVDFKSIKQEIHGRLDHQYLNDVIEMNPTAENIAKWCLTKTQDAIDKDWNNKDDKGFTRPFCSQVSVQESEGNIAYYERIEDDRYTGDR